MRRWLASCSVLLLCAGACASPPAPARHSIVLITVDTLRADHVNAQVAPTLDRLARESIAFDHAISVGPLTLPGHASLLTGLYPPAHGLRDNHLFSLPKDMPTYTAWLKARGYATAAFVSAIVLDKRYGLDAGFDVYDDEMPAGETGGRAPERSAVDTLQRADAWLAARSGSGPSFVWIHLFEPHAPYRTGSYAGEVAVVDRDLGRFFTALRERRAWDDLVMSVTSDHGESLGEHGEQTHGFFVYDSTIRIPWILKAPAQTPRRIASQVRLVDVLPTMIDLAGAATKDAPLPSRVHGESLAPYLAAGSLPSLEAYSETWLPRHQFNWSELKAMRTAHAKYIDAPDPELYLLQEDPAEAHNAIAAQRDRADALKKSIAGLERESAPTARRESSSSDVVDAEKFLALGYIGHAPSAEPVAGERLPDPKRKVEIYRLVMSSLELSERGKPADALAALQKAESLDPAVTQVHFLKGTILGGQDRYAEAAKALERAVALNPRHVLARFKLALAYVRLGRGAEAERALHTVIQDEPRNVRAYHNLAALAYTRGDLARAEALERQALAIDPTYFEAWNTLGAIYIVSKRPADALDAMQKATSLNPSSAQAQRNLSLARQANGDLSGARAAAEKACALDPRFCR